VGEGAHTAAGRKARATILSLPNHAVTTLGIAHSQKRLNIEAALSPFTTNKSHPTRLRFAGHQGVSRVEEKPQSLSRRGASVVASKLGSIRTE